MRIQKFIGSLLFGLVLFALALWGYESYLGKTNPDPAVAARRSGSSNWKWGQLIHRPSDIPGLSYELTPGFQGMHLGVPVSINAEGMRRGPLPEDLESAIRIAVLGDSTTFGFGVRGEETYSSLLQEFLSTEERPVEVLNFGVSGYSTRDESVVLERKALAYEPDQIVIGYNLNDPDIERRQPLHRFFEETPWWMRNHTVANILTTRFLERLRRIGQGDLFRYAHAPDEPNWRSVCEAFQRMAELVKPSATPVLVVIFPSGLVGEPASYRYRNIHAQVAKEAEHNGFQVLDLAEAYSKLDELGQEYLLPDTHPNPLGHRSAAQAIATTLGSTLASKGK